MTSRHHHSSSSSSSSSSSDGESSVPATTAAGHRDQPQQQQQRENSTGRVWRGKGFWFDGGIENDLFDEKSRGGDDVSRWEHTAPGEHIRLVLTPNVGRRAAHKLEDGEPGLVHGGDYDDGDDGEVLPSADIGEEVELIDKGGNEPSAPVTGWRKFMPWGKKDGGEPAHPALLGEWRATAIAGNDITSSCLYTAGLCTVAAGKYAPISLLLVVVSLYLYRNVYSEVGRALPMNGGSYTVLLNTTTKVFASLAACLTTISYIATAVVSANTAMSYLHDGIYDGFPVFWGTIVILGIFAALNLLGLSESANVALGIFALHIATLTLLCIWGTIKLIPDWTQMKLNWQTEPIRSVPLDIFYGYCAALLGVTGFETSANYIEEQKDGTFPKTLRNMWYAIAIFNPLTSFLSLGLLSVDEIIDNSDALLVRMAQVCGGRPLSIFVSVDATLVLCGSVLTAYVGIGGLVRRMTLDRCLPGFLLAVNPLTKTCYLIILGFFAVTSSLFLVSLGNINILTGVYAVAFLSVMSLFAVGNILLKYKRGAIPRDVQAAWPVVILALCSTVAGLIGNIVRDVSMFVYFIIYAGATIAIVMSMFARVRIIKLVLYFLHRTFMDKYIGDWLRKKVKEIKRQSVIFFAKTDNLEIMNKAVLYTRDNELTERMIIVHFFKDKDQIPARLVENVRLLDEMYPKLRIDLVTVHGEFTPFYVNKLSTQLEVPHNFMFITCPSERFPEKISAFGGVRVVTH